MTTEIRLIKGNGNKYEVKKGRFFKNIVIASSIVDVIISSSIDDDITIPANSELAGLKELGYKFLIKHGKSEITMFKNKLGKDPVNEIIESDGELKLYCHDFKNFTTFEVVEL